jgi:hypothetical protein
MFYETGIRIRIRIRIGRGECVQYYSCLDVFNGDLVMGFLWRW